MSMAVQADHDWSPDWAIHPGEYVAEHLEARELSQAAFARLARLTPKLVSTIINGRNPITADTAIRLERVLGVKAYIWTGLQAKWDLHQAREAERGRIAADWLARFPVKEMKAHRLLPDTTDEGCLVNALLSLFGVGAPDAYDQKLGTLAVCHRQSRAHQTSRDHVFTWLMIGEARARAMDLPAFDPARFLQGVAEIRGLTRQRPETFGERMISLCAAAGVALVFAKPFSKTCLFGSARWIEGDRAVIQMSLRMKTNDHFWWTFFHEAGHVVLHRGRTFADDQAGQGDGVEAEADAWAEEHLFGRDRLAGLIAHPPRSRAAVLDVAKRLDLHPGIVVGALQHHGVLPFTHLNGLKAKFDWAS